MARTGKYSKGEVIVIEGEYTSEAYFVRTGRVEVYRPGPPERQLGILGPGAVFGEMAWITELPRSASIRALEDVDANVMARDEFLALWHTKPEVLVPVFRVLCERLRTLSLVVSELSQRVPDAHEVIRAHIGADADGGEPGVHPLAPNVHVTIEGVGVRAAASLGAPSVALHHFPYRIGRDASREDPFSHNELRLVDPDAKHVSANHCLIGCAGSRFFVIDRGSRTGTVVNGVLVGGRAATRRAELEGGQNEIVIGRVDSPYCFRVTISGVSESRRHGV